MANLFLKLNQVSHIIFYHVNLHLIFAFLLLLSLVSFVVLLIYFIFIFKYKFNIQIDSVMKEQQLTTNCSTSETDVFILLGEKI